ncbi:MAG: bifunctional diaminohydroxyphosphoribosylaminopyrimidine [Bacteroidota bacterium]
MIHLQASCLKVRNPFFMLGLTANDCMELALELAAAGRGYVSPNPMVGAVLCYDGRVIGQGWHQQFGGPHAEVNCLNAVSPEDQHLISKATMYVTLEPCAHHGKTPPCADLLIRSGIQHVVVAAVDPFDAVKGQGIARMRLAGLRVEQGLLAKEATELNSRFFTYHIQHRPYITLKWAETSDGFMGSGSAVRLFISGEETNKLVHTWRAAEDAILIGAGTAVLDDPLLNVRLVEGHSPLRIIVDVSAQLPAGLKMFNDGQPVVVVNKLIEGVEGHVTYLKMDLARGPEPLLDWLYEKKIQGLMVEGGKKTLQYFLDSGFWDEIKIITNTTLNTGGVVRVPEVPAFAVFQHITQVGKDRIVTYKKRR